jgi:hypothetical protein
MSNQRLNINYCCENENNYNFYSEKKGFYNVDICRCKICGKILDVEYSSDNSCL